MEEMNLLKQVALRYLSKSPKLFKVIQIVCSGVVVLALLAKYFLTKEYIVLPNHTLQLGILDVSNDIWKYALGAGTIAALTTTDPTLIDNKTKENVVKNVINSPAEIQVKIDAPE